MPSPPARPAPRLLALSRDVTQHKKNETALCEAIQFNREIIEGAAEGIIVYDAELRYQLASADLLPEEPSAALTKRWLPPRPLLADTRHLLGRAE